MDQQQIENDLKAIESSTNPNDQATRQAMADLSSVSAAQWKQMMGSINDDLGKQGFAAISFDQSGNLLIGPHGQSPGETIELNQTQSNGQPAQPASSPPGAGAIHR